MTRSPHRTPEPVSRILGLVESPAQLLNTIEWAYAEQADADLVVLGPTDPVTRFQLHRLSELARAEGFTIEWAEVRTSWRRTRALAELAKRARTATTVVIGDPYSGIIHGLLNLTRNPEIVVVDDGTATIRYAEQWADGSELKRWHIARRSRPAKMLGLRADRMLGDRSPSVRLFTAMPIDTEIPHTANTYAWVRQRFAAPEILSGTDLMGSSLVETGVVDLEAYLAGVVRLVREHGVARYLPHRHETQTKLARIAQVGVQILRPDLPMEAYARRGPIGRVIRSFPSTILHTLPLVLGDTGVMIEAMSVDDDWFTADARGEEKTFIHGIGSHRS